MSRFRKIAIVLLLIVLLTVSASAVALWYFFASENLTPIVNKQAKKYLNCETIIEKVEPTFFSSFPFFGIEINNICLKEKSINKSGKKDTIVFAKKCLASLDIKAYIFDNNIILKPFLLEDGYVNFKVDSLKKSNFDVLFATDSKKSEVKKDTTIPNLKISKFEILNFKARYLDESSLMKADVDGLDAILNFDLENEIVDVESKVKLKHLLFVTNDSLAIKFEAYNSKAKFSTSGDSSDKCKTNLHISIDNMFVSMAGNTMLQDMKIVADFPMDVNIIEKNSIFDDAKIIFNDKELNLVGNIKMIDYSSYDTDISFSCKEWDVEELVALTPKIYAAPLKGLTVKGLVDATGTIKGIASNKDLPVVETNVEYSKGQVKYFDYPTVRDASASVKINLDMNKGRKSDMSIVRSKAKILNSYMNLKGTISNFMEMPDYDFIASGDFVMADFQPYVPKEYKLKIKGVAKANMHTKFKQSAIDKQEFHRIYFNGDFDVKDLLVTMNDTMKVDMPSSNIKLLLPTQKSLDKNLMLANIKVITPLMYAEASPLMNATTKDLRLSIDVNNLAKGLSAPITTCSFHFAKLVAKADTLAVISNNTLGRLVYAPRLKDKHEVADINTLVDSKSMQFIRNDSTLLDLNNFFTNTSLTYDTTEKNVILQWDPLVDVRFSDAIYNLGKKLHGQIPNISFTLSRDTMKIKKANMILGNSDFSLTGELVNISKYLKNEALLKGDFDFVSKKTDVFELMDIFNGMGAKDSTLVAVKDAADNDATTVAKNTAGDAKAAHSPDDDDPFMVPLGVEIHLNTKIGETVVNNHVIENIKGGLTVKDGVLVLEQMGFTSKAANMQLTAMYRSSRKNHLFSSIDFHLLDINIAELIELLPYVDTMVPMLKSFKGEGEFHLAGETYLKSDYSLKTSTIRGAAAFEGQNLTLMDNETFTMIAKKLLFNKKSVNVVDSLSVEMTLFRDEIDVYPFLFVMDDYKAVIAGRHNMDNSFNYHISVTDSPLPIRLGLNVMGTMENLDYKLVPCKYKHLYEPNKQGALEQQTLKLKKLISTSLKQNVKPIVK